MVCHSLLLLMGHSTQSLPSPKCVGCQLNHDNGSVVKHWISGNRLALKSYLPQVCYVPTRNILDQPRLCEDSLLLLHRVHKVIQIVHSSILNFAIHFDSSFNFKNQKTKLMGKKYMNLTTTIVFFAQMKKSVNAYAVRDKNRGGKVLNWVIHLFSE